MTQSRHAISYLAEIVRLGLFQPMRLAVFVGIYLMSSFVQMIGLVCFYHGFALAGGGADAVSMPAWMTSALEPAGESAWLVLFCLFLLFALAAAGLEHAGWIIRLRLLAAYEADLMCRGLSLINELDPRDRVELSRREMVLAVRGDCKSMRVVFQLLLLCFISLVQISFPLWYVLHLDAAAAAAGLAVVLAGFVPVAWLARRAARTSLRREDVHAEAGSRVSEAIVRLQEEELSRKEMDSVLADVRRAISDQQRLWRRQYEVRSLARQIPLAFGLMGTFAILLIGVWRISSDAMTWGELLTLVVASRVVFAPFVQVAGRWIKSAEHLPQARRHLDFMRGRHDAAAPAPKRDLAVPRVGALQIRGLRLPAAGGGEAVFDLDLGRGQMLSIVDQRIDDSNPLLQQLRGQRYVRAGSVLLDGQDINAVAWASLRRALGSFEIVGNMTGTLLECAQRWQPGAQGRDILALADTVMDGHVHDWMPQGLATPLDRAGKRTDRAVQGCCFLVGLYKHHHSGRSVLVLPFYSRTNPVRRIMEMNYVRAFRETFITIWVDSAPRVELGEQIVAVFDGGAFVGMGDLAWFRRRFPQWPEDIPPAAQPAAGEAKVEEPIEMAELELDEDE